MGFNTQQSGLRSNLSEINVTPLVDVMLVLLIIFMVTAPMMQSGLEVNLPSAETKANPSPGGAVVSIDKDRNMTFEYNIKGNSQTVVFNTNLAMLKKHVDDYFQGKEKKIVYLKADEALYYKDIIKIMDVLKLSGVETVGMIVKEKTEK